ncbi:hypothetical protein Pcinc_027496 [Petrolisthes cinctipes]|uniref:Uncharacterized protein n=1 Tax=Petrolisthes cinctipes TaxID=88211 RepID=A0AAE1K8J2_PETCI|nr:hypothetical protein Pcinc_027496 [Petrolisthes cinctipes]
MLAAAAAASGPTTTCAGSSVVGMRAQHGGAGAAGGGRRGWGWGWWGGGVVATAAAGVWSGCHRLPGLLVPLVAGRPDPSVLLKTLCEARPCQVWCIDPHKVLWRGVAAAGPPPQPPQPPGAPHSAKRQGKHPLSQEGSEEGCKGR